MTDDTAIASEGRPVRTILFVCTGNTCRSPMAQAIAEDLLRAAGHDDTFFIASAGVTAGSGAPMTPEAAQALERLGIRPHDHRSTPLSGAMIEKAEAVFGLTAAHLNGINALADAPDDNAVLLDPAGEDVADPIGMGLDMYIETARRLRTLVALRLRELGVPVDAEALS